MISEALPRRPGQSEEEYLRYLEKHVQHVDRILLTQAIILLGGVAIIIITAIVITIYKLF